MSGYRIWNPTGTVPNFWRKSADSNDVSVISCFRKLPPASVSFRHHPPSSVRSRCASLLVRVDDGDMSGGQDCDVGGAHLETQHAAGQISGENRPTLVLIMPFPASRSFRLPPSGSVSGRFWSVCLMATCLGARMMISGGHIWKPNWPLCQICGEIGRF